jgi:hypothetical protein
MTEKEQLELCKRALRTIRDSTYRNAMQLRGMAMHALDSIADSTLKEKK